VIKAEEEAKLYNITRKRHVHEIDNEAQPKTDFTQQTQSESLKNKMNTLYKYSQMAARVSTGSEME